MRRGASLSGAREVRVDPCHGPITKIAYGERYVMVRRDLATPYVMPIERWRELPKASPA